MGDDSPKVFSLSVPPKKTLVSQSFRLYTLPLSTSLSTTLYLSLLIAPVHSPAPVVTIEHAERHTLSVDAHIDLMDTDLASL